ncbi:hypothetical protein GOP47_0025363 [Adiantum capillus-veneris]|uniref:Uncharacterized protein n=1 Tax=Adiantum capillus-veneris TaxID=13818 RepID=A0A9D4U0B0_ADICA|nr:hypothetical protein GOP47_0025363 [Adiantum capillus-veneris]
MDLEGEETPLTLEREESWDEHWRTVNQRFEEYLALDPDWGPYLSRKVVHILDGNNRHNAWMDCISTGDLSMHFCVLCKFYVFERRDVGELMFSLSRLNKMHDYAFVPITFGDHLFQLRRLGESDLTTLMAHLNNEDKLWVEREMQSASTRGRPSWLHLPIQIMTWLLFKDEMEKKIDEASNGPLVESNGDAFWCEVLSLPWHASTNHVATEEKLNMIGFVCIRATYKIHIVKLLDNSQAEVRSLEGMPNDKTKIMKLGSRIQNDIKNADLVRFPGESQFTSFVVLCRRKYFKRAFKAYERGIKFSHDIDHQPGLQSATRRVVYRFSYNITQIFLVKKHAYFFLCVVLSFGLWLEDGCFLKLRSTNWMGYPLLLVCGFVLTINLICMLI